AAPPAAAPAAPAAPTPAAPAPAVAAADALANSGPAARKLVEDNKLDPATIPATGKDGRLTKGDVLAAIERPAPPASAAPAPAPAPKPAQPSGPRPEAAREERVRMTRLRQRIAERLKEAQNTAAMLTTFNEVDMSQVMAM